MGEGAKRDKPRKWRLFAGVGCALLGLLVVGGCPFLYYRFDRHVRAGECGHGLRIVHCACHMYAEDNGDWFPENLDQLVPKYLDNPRDCLGALREELPKPHYELVRGLRSDMPGDFILIFDKSLDNHGGAGRNVLFADAHVEWWPAEREGEFQKKLAAQLEAVAAWRKSGKPVKSLNEIYAKILESKE